MSNAEIIFARIVRPLTVALSAISADRGYNGLAVLFALFSIYLMIEARGKGAKDDPR